MKKYLKYGSLYKPYLLCLFLEYTLNQPDNLKSLLQYTETVEYFILNMLYSSEEKTKVKPFISFFIIILTIFLLFKEKKDHTDFKLSHKLFM